MSWNRSGQQEVRPQTGITGLETAIILIAFVVVATVFAFTVLSTGVFAAERSKETIYAGLQEARSSIEPRGSVIAYTGGFGGGPTQTVYKVTFVVGNSASGAEVDLTPPYSADASGIDPDFVNGAEYRTIVSYTDRNQHLSDVPWTIEFLGEASTDNLLEVGEKAEITVWLMDRNNAIAETDPSAVQVMDTSTANGGGVGGIEATGTLVGKSTRFVLELTPQIGAALTVQRSIPPGLRQVMNLN